MRNTFILFFLCLLLLPILASSQQLFDFKCKTYTTNDGLVHNFTKKCLQDSKGFLWIITQNGLSRFDGLNFTNFEHSVSDSTSLPENDLEDIAIDDADNIWLSYAKGLCYYSQATHQFKKIFSAGKILESQSVLFDKKRKCLWSINYEGYTKIDSRTQSVSLIKYKQQEKNTGKIYPSFLDSKDRLWIPYGRRRYHCIDIKTGQQYFHPERMQPTSFYEDDEHNIWITTWQTGFRSIRSIDAIHQHEKYPDPFLFIGEDQFDFISSSVAQNNYLTGDSILWVAKETDGILFFNKKSGKFIQQIVYDPNNKNGIPSNYIENIWCDRNGTMWICSWHGLAKINKQEQQFRSKEIPWLNVKLYNCVADIADDPYDKNIAWLTAEGSGVSKFNRLTGEVISRNFYSYNDRDFMGEDKNYNWRWTGNFVKEKNVLWTISYAGLIKIDNGKISKFQVERNGDLIYPKQVKQFSENILWIAGDDGLCRFNTADNSYKVFIDSTRKSYNHFTDIEIHNDSILLIGSDYGVKQFNTSTQSFKLLDCNITGLADGSQSVCRTIELIGDNLYIGSMAGLKVCNLTTKTTSFLGKDQGIDKLSYNRLKKDHAGNLWIFTSHALFRYDPKKKSFEKFTGSDGIYDLSEDPINFFTYNNLFQIGYRMAITSFDPLQVNVNTVKSNPVITDIIINGKMENVSIDSFQTKSLQLTYDQNEIVFNYTSPDFTNSDKVSFLIQLEGHDKDWVNAGTKRTATYNNLLPGNYVFKVKAANSSGVWNETISSFQFYIHPPFWKTWWFRSIIVLLGCGLIYSIYKYRVHQVKKFYEVRSNISRNLHDEIGATLSSINIYSDVARKKITETDTLELIDKMYDASAKAMDSMSDIVWYVNPQNDQLEDMLVRMREHAVPMLEAKDINVRFETSAGIDAVKLNMQQRQHLYLIFKEAINNLLKYADAKNAAVVFSKHNNHLNLLIKDDGKGFDDQHGFNGNGLKNMQYRTLQLKGNISIQSSPGNGTEIKITFPVT